MAVMTLADYLSPKVRPEIEVRGAEALFAEIVPPLIRNAATCRNLAVRMRSIGNHLEARRYDNEANMFEARAVVAGLT